jgi:hypothetical protein
MQLGSLIGFLRRIRQLQSFLLEERLTLLIVLNSAKIACIGLRARPGLFSLVARLGGVEVRPLSLVRSLLSRRVG